jgi:hypothetical protein
MRRLSESVGMRLGAFLAVFAMGGAVLGAVPAVPEGTSHMSGLLLRAHPYLFTEAQRAALEAAHRDLREAEGALRSAETDEARAAAEARAASAAARVLDVLEGCEKAVRLSLAEEPPVLPKLPPFEMPGDGGGALFRIDAGGDEGPGRCTASQVDLGDLRGEGNVIPVAVGSSGVTWATVSLAHIPKKRVVLRLALQREGQPDVLVPIDVRTPEPGRLKITVLSDDTGEPTPAMIRLVWGVDGIDRVPSNGIEFGPQFDYQGHGTGRRPSNYPGRLGGEYWCIPGPLDMEVPPGEWEIRVRRGAEHIPIFDTVSVASGEVVAKVYRPKRWVDMRHLGWYSGDDHVHCRIVSDLDAERLMAWVRAEDVHLANVVKMGDIYRTWFEQRGFGTDYRVVEGDRILSPGQECPRTHQQLGHTLAMNTREMVRDTEQYFLYDTVFDRVHAQGGLSGYAHVNSGMFHVHRDMSINIPKGKIDFAEILQFNNLGTALWYEFLNLGMAVTASAGSDVPWGGTIGEVRVYCYVGDQPFTADAWFAGMRRGHTFVTNGPMLTFDVDGALPGDTVTVDRDRPLRVRARAWGHPDRLVPTRLEIVRHGDVVKSVASSDRQQRSLSVDFEVQSGYGFWIAARAYGSDGSACHTSPVYVTRQGLRWWKYDAVESLIAKRLASLDEVEQIVADAMAQVAAGSAGGDRAVEELADQAAPLLERVAAARALYADLKRVAAEEAPKRRSGAGGGR